MKTALSLLLFGRYLWVGGVNAVDTEDVGLTLSYFAYLLSKTGQVTKCLSS